MKMKINRSISKRGTIFGVFGLFLFPLGYYYLSHYSFIPYASEGHDALRYEYFARQGLPASLRGNDSYNVVTLMTFIYSFGVEYWSWLLLMLVFALVASVSSPIMAPFLFQPIALYYYLAPGKDGITIIYLLLVVSLIRSLVGRMINFYLTILLLLLTPIVFYVRDSIVFFGMIAVAIALGSRSIGVISTLVSLYFFTQRDFSLHNETVKIGGGGIGDLLRIASFGKDIVSTSIRFFLNLFSPILQVAASINRLSSERTVYGALELFGHFWLFSQIWRFRSSSLKPFIFAAVNLTLVFPFYHGRYMVIIAVVIAFSEYIRNFENVNRMSARVSDPE